MMRHPWGRWSLVVVAVAAAVGACAWAVTLESRARSVRLAMTTAEVHATSLRGAAAEVRRALAAMASPGQAAVGWSRRAGAGIDEMRTQLTGLTAAPAGGASSSAVDALDRLAAAERRLRDHAAGGKPLMAADVAFGEAMPQLEELERQVGDIVATVSVAANGEIATLRDQQMAAVAAALIVLLLSVLILAPLRRAVEPVAASPPEPLPVADAVASLSARPIAEAARQPAAAVETRPPFDLRALAAVCADLSVVTDAETLPAVLERATAVLGARGLIVWLADGDRRVLRVAATAGYDARLVGRLGPVDVADDNPTARALASGRSAIAPARDGRLAAAAVPIAGPAGIRGVLSAEFRTADAATLSEATAGLQIVAAQLALLVGGADGAAVDTALRTENAPL